MRVAPVFALAGLMAAALSAGCHRQAAPAATELAAGSPSAASPSAAAGVAYVCPMDRDIRSEKPGKCARCGMELVAGIPDPNEYHLDLTVEPQPAARNQPVNLTFAVFDPWKHNPVHNFLTVHEKLFHAFIVSRDLEYFVHDHPVWKDGVFRYTATFPRPGMYRVLADFYPQAATPQLLTRTLFVTGEEAPPRPLARDDSAKSAENLRVAVSLSPNVPVAGGSTQMRFTLQPADGLERYLGAWGHMLVVSDDLIDMIHTHPSLSDGSPEMQFAVVFPRPRAYRIWVQFQRQGVVNTAHFDIPVASQDQTAH